MADNNIKRREFIKNTTTTAIGLSLMPSYILGRNGTSPNNKLNIGLIGCGTQSFKMLPGWLKQPELQFVAVCDPNTESYDYPQWGRPQGETRGAAGGREVAKRFINDYYAKNKSLSNYKGCNAYADFRELLEKENDLDAVFIMTPDHLHATIALAAFKKNIKVGSHKPIGNFMKETRVVCEEAKKTNIPTQLFAWMDEPGNHVVESWIKQGAIGNVKELHRWTNRPMWPQGSPYLPTNTPPIPKGFDWDLWLGPSLPRTYSPDYTHTVFRGWYEFGAGCLADMGYYGFWVDWRILDLGMPVTAEGSANVYCELKDFRSTWIKNNLSYPHAATLQWEVPFNNKNEMLDVYWYEGGIRPKTPKALKSLGKPMPKEGVLFVGEKGMILANYAYGDPLLFGTPDAEKLMASIKVPKIELLDQIPEMIQSFQGGKPSRGSFVNAQTVAEAICLGNLAIRVSDRLEWDNKNLMVTNFPEANEYIARKSRPGWEI